VANDRIGFAGQRESGSNDLRGSSTSPSQRYQQTCNPSLGDMPTSGYEQIRSQLSHSPKAALRSINKLVINDLSSTIWATLLR
jgi:hypothetical protein